MTGKPALLKLEHGLITLKELKELDLFYWVFLNPELTAALKKHLLSFSLGERKKLAKELRSWHENLKSNLDEELLASYLTILTWLQDPTNTDLEEALRQIASNCSTAIKYNETLAVVRTVRSWNEEKIELLGGGSMEGWMKSIAKGLVAKLN